MANLGQECEQAATRVRSMRIRNFRYTLEGGIVTLEGEALTPEAIDSAAKVFAATSVREVRNQLRHSPPDPANPGSLRSPGGYVEVEEMPPSAARLSETLIWQVRPGDTLDSIATEVYGNEEAAERIWYANRHQIGVNHQIHAGQKLRLPPR